MCHRVRNPGSAILEDARHPRGCRLGGGRHREDTVLVDLSGKGQRKHESRDFTSAALSSPIANPGDTRMVGVVSGWQRWWVVEKAEGRRLRPGTSFLQPVLSTQST